MLFGRHHDTPPPPSTTLTRVRRIMADILRVPLDRVHPSDSFTTLTGIGLEGEREEGLDEDFLDLCAFEVAVKREFNLDITEDENDTLFQPQTTALQFASYIDHHHSR